MAEAAAPAVSVRSWWVASLPLTMTCGSPASSVTKRISVRAAQAATAFGVAEVDVLPGGGQADGPVERAGIEVMPAQALGDGPTDRALAGARGAIDGQNGDGGGHGV